ncbi:Hsp70 family protein [Nocardia sp. X0981]
MSSVLGVSVGAGAIRLARPPADEALGTGPESFEQRTFVVPPETPSAERAALSVAAALNSNPDITGTVLACRDEQQARALHAAMAEQKLTAYDIVPDIEAILEFAVISGALQGVTTLGVYDLGASGLSVTVVEVASRTVLHTERTGDISGEYFDSLIREQQINSGRIAHPPDPAGLAQLDALCRAAKERLSSNTAVALPSEYGPVLLTQENFSALIARAIETSVLATREIIRRPGRAVQAVLAVGGGVRIPLVSQTLREILEMPVLVPPEPEAATARGAALLARRPPAARPAREPDAVPTVTADGSAPPPGQPTATGTRPDAPVPAPDPDERTVPTAGRAGPPGPAPARPAPPEPQPGIFGPPAGTAAELPPPHPHIAAAPPSTTDVASDGGTSQAPAAEPGPPAPRLSEAEDPPTVALRIPAKLVPQRSFDTPPRRNREINAAVVAVSVLVVVASIGIGLGYGQHMFRQESTTIEGTTRAPATTSSEPSPAPGMAGATVTTPSEHASLAEPPPVAAPRPTQAPTTTNGPNTFQVPGLPPIVVPTLPPLFPSPQTPPPRR